MRDISRDRRQMTRTPSSSDSAPATTAAATSPIEWPMTAPGCTPYELHRGGQRHLHGEHGGLDPVDTGHRLGRRHRLGDREPGLLGDQRLRSPRRSRRTPVRVASRPAPIPAHCEPWPENTHTGPRSSLPDRGLIRSVAIGDLAQRRQPAPGGVLASTAVRTGRCAAPTRQGVGQVRWRHTVSHASATQSASRPEVRRSSSAEVDDSGNNSGPAIAGAGAPLSCAAGSGILPLELARQRRARLFPTDRRTTPPPAVGAGRWSATGWSSAARRVRSRFERGRQADG